MLRLPCPRAAAAPAPRSRPDEPGTGGQARGDELAGLDALTDFPMLDGALDGLRPSLAVAAELERCDAYVVVVADPMTGAVDSYGPFDGARADREVARRRDELDAEGLTDVSVQRVRHHRPE